MRTPPPRKAPEPKKGHSSGSKPGQPTERSKDGDKQDKDRGRAQQAGDRGVSSRTSARRAPPAWLRPPRPVRTAATRKPCTCHLTTLKSPGLTMARRPLFHPHSHSRPARRCCAFTAAAEDGTFGSCRPHPTRSPFWPKASTHRCSMRRGQRDTSNGSPWARGLLQHP